MYCIHKAKEVKGRQRFRVTPTCVGYSSVVGEVESARRKTDRNKIPFFFLRGGKCVLIYYYLYLFECVPKICYIMFIVLKSSSDIRVMVKREGEWGARPRASSLS